MTTTTKRRGLYVLGTALLLAFAGFAFTSFRDSLTPYVSFQEARTAGRFLQVAGGLEPESSAYDTESELLRFTLVEPQTGERLPVRYPGLKPANFEEAVSIVAIGRYDAASGELAAEKLLVKCPSKYQGVEGEVKEYSAGAPAAGPTT
jgi:cytochrome c-type biogenesis protein CcmE